MPKPQIYDVDCWFHHETDAAILVSVGDEEPVWLPKSVVEYEEPQVERGRRRTTVTGPVWLLKDKLLV